MPVTWGTVNLEGLETGEISLENSRLLIRYRRHKTDFEDNHIKDFIIKGTDEDQAGESYGLNEVYFGHQGSGYLTAARIVHQGPDRTLVYLEWSDGKAAHTVTIYPDSPVVRFDYGKFGTGICDIGSPGGLAKGGTYVAYGGDQWQKGYALYPLGFYFRLPPHDFGMTGWKGNGEGDPAPGPLDYKGWFIAGVYNPANGRGFGRVMPVAVIDCINLLSGQGFEWVPYCHREKSPYTGYLFAVTGGEDQILRLGKQIADRHNENKR